MKSHPSRRGSADPESVLPSDIDAELLLGPSFAAERKRAPALRRYETAPSHVLAAGADPVQQIEIEEVER
jgi:hypothetical protein